MSDHLDRAAEVLEVHEVVFIDHEVGYECGCNEHGDGHPDGLPFLTDALKHQARALDAAGLLASPDVIAAAKVEALRDAVAAVLEDGDPDNIWVAAWLQMRADWIEREAGESDADA